VGMWPHVDRSIWPGNVAVSGHLMVFDLVYNPIATQLLQQARVSGARRISGLEMLLHQGAAAFELWIGESAPIEAMRAALKEAAS
ncbi:MAG: shikimate dehydrogenase, partial [Candidatus Bipolaricaulota bacterium]|nr:shikimate dehydrogenase [Candidatus Bipolaricaulota bacterium]